MNLLDALRFNSGSCVAFVGAGGKTTALFELARQLPSPVLITTTTHFAAWQLQLADHHYSLERLEDLYRLDGALPGEVILLSGTIEEHERVGGLKLPVLERVRTFAKQRGLSLLVEADGARQLPLKAPAEYEPEIPPFVEVVVVVAGLSGLGKPLGSQWVHRVNYFAALSGLAPGDIITSQALSRVLVHPMGGLKNVPRKARRVALLNQVDTLTLQSQAYSLAKLLMPAFNTVIVASLGSTAIDEQKGEETKKTGDDFKRSTSIFAVHEPVAGIVLAAGSSTRFGQPKLTMPWKGEPLVHHVVLRALQSGLSPVVIVTGDCASQIRVAIEDLPVNCVHNADWKAGQSTSIKTGINALPPESEAVVFLLADQPQIPASLLKALVERHAQTLASIVAPKIDGQRGNPVLFDRRTFDALLLLKGDIGGRVLFSQQRIEWVPWHDPSLLLDVDTLEDYQHLLDLDG